MPSLLTARGGRHALPLDRDTVLGRAGECDLIVEDMASSRRHARLFADETSGIVSIEDLGSHNGTFVNDEPVSGPTPLHDGSRIRIGTTVFLFTTREMEAAQEEEDDDLLDTGTVSLEQFSGGGGVDEHLLRVARKEGEAAEFAGQLNSFSLIEVLQLLMQTGRSGTLHVELDSGHARIEVRDGEVCSARYQELEGFQALLFLARRQNGIFWLVETYIPCRKTIREPSQSLLFELCRVLDEFRNKSSAVS